MRALIRGIGDIGSAVAHALHCASVQVMIHDEPQPTWTRRKMAFTDAIFDGQAELSGVLARRIDDPSQIAGAIPSAYVHVAVDALEMVLQEFRPDVLVDARMRKREFPEAQMHLALFTVGLGPNFVAGRTTHVVVETAWGDALGHVIIEGGTRALSGEPRMLGGWGIERVVYSPAEGVFSTAFAIGEAVTAGEMIAQVADVSLTAPLDGRLRGLTRSGVPVRIRTKVIEIDPRGDEAVFTGIGERPAKIAEGVLAAIRRFAGSLAS